jgi:RNA polymerase sigma-70 factor (ECF subfamily)
MWRRKLLTEFKYKEFAAEEAIMPETPFQAFEKSEKKEIINRAIKKLPENQQEVIILFFLAELKISEIATILDKPENSVKTWLRRGKEQLEAILDPIFVKEYK